VTAHRARSAAARSLRLAAAIALLCAGAAAARGETVTVGVFAPSAPFPSTASRVELAARLGEHVGRALGVAGVGRVYARAADFAAAVRRGEVTVALVDPAYLAGAGAGGYTVIAGVAQGGDTAQPWQVIARAGTRTVAELRGKRVLVPSSGGREADLVLNALLGGAERDLFGKIEAAPDTASAIATLGLGKADAAIVPAGVAPPAGAAQVVALPPLATPVLVAYGAVTAARRAALVRAAASFAGDAVIGAFKETGDAGVRALAQRLAAPVKRGPLLVPAARLVTGDLVQDRALSIERTPASAFVVAPGAR
jgi:ethanolamine utilization microcompartment shell protein EutS